MKKAAIITWCSNGKANYGQILQCYAMVRLLRKYDYKAKVIRYRVLGKNENHAMKYKGIFRRLYETYYELNMENISFVKRKLLFQLFMIRRIPHTIVNYNVSEIEKCTQKFDLLVCGSDQIWNPKAYDPVYYLGFGDVKQKRYALAPSLGITKTTGVEGNLKKAIYYIEKLDKVYVREKKGAEILQCYSDKEINTMLDPTLYIDSKEWDKIAKNRIIQDKYMLCYMLGDLSTNKRKIRAIKEALDINKIVIIATKNTNKNVSSFGDVMYNVSPEMFLSLIKYAEVVCTDSFHGTAFSIVYNKRFYVTERNVESGVGNFDRIRNLLEEKNINLSDVIL